MVFGLEVAAEVFDRRGAGASSRSPTRATGATASRARSPPIAGPARALLAGERTALNFLGHLSGVATLTARYVEAVAGTSATILDTRKTTPGLRALEKAAVAPAAAEPPDRARRRDPDQGEPRGARGRCRPRASSGRERPPESPVEVECRTPAEVGEALAAGAERLLLDNMDVAGLEAAVAARDEAGPAAELEASGGVTLANVAEIAATGVDFISVGALTHSAPGLDLSMLLDPTL